ncbi:unnamed protein product, partial [Allacma fusca]
ISNTDC